MTIFTECNETTGNMLESAKTCPMDTCNPKTQSFKINKLENKKKCLAANYEVNIDNPDLQAPALSESLQEQPMHVSYIWINTSEHAKEKIFLSTFAESQSKKMERVATLEITKGNDGEKMESTVHTTFA